MFTGVCLEVPYGTAKIENKDKLLLGITLLG